MKNDFPYLITVWLYFMIKIAIFAQLDLLSLISFIVFTTLTLFESFQQQLRYQHMNKKTLITLTIIVNILRLTILSVDYHQEYDQSQYIFLGIEFQKLTEIDQNPISRLQIITKISYVIYTSLFLIITKALQHEKIAKSNGLMQFYIVVVIGQRILILIQKYIQNSNELNRQFKRKTAIQSSMIGDNIENQQILSLRIPQSLLNHSQIEDNLKLRISQISKEVPTKPINVKNPFQDLEFHKMLLTQYPEGKSIKFIKNKGIIVLGEDDDEIICFNECLMQLIESDSLMGSKQRLMLMENCKSQYEEVEKYYQLLKGLNKTKRFIVVKDDIQELSEFKEIQFQEDVIQKLSFVSDSDNVRAEYKKSLEFVQKKIQQQNQKNTKKQPGESGEPLVEDNFDNFQNNKTIFYFETKMLCTLQDDAQQKSEENNVQTSEDLFEVTIKPFSYQQNPYVLIMVKDVTLFNRMSVLKNLNDNLSQMLSNVAHEFRTPLNCIILLTETLMSNYQFSRIQREEQKNIYVFLSIRYLQPIITSASQLNSLVNDLLDRAQWQAGKFKIVNKEFNIVKLIRNVQKLLLPQAQQKKLFLNIEIEERIQQVVQSDPNRIRQILINLVSNSLKFTIKGGITISLKQIEQIFYEISVRDTGIGIDIEDQKKLFKQFGKIEESSHLNSQGVGLGLLISNMMAQILSQKNDISQGLIVFSEGKNKGTQFSFKFYDFNEILSVSNESQSMKFDQQQSGSVENFQNFSPQYSDISPKLPDHMLNQGQIHQKQNRMFRQNSNIPIVKRDSLQVYDDHEMMNPEMSSSTYMFKDCECIEILIVDDQPFNILALKNSLNKINPKVEGANGFDEAVEFLEKQQHSQCCQWVKIILMDIEMPFKDGFETTKEIRMIENILKRQRISQFKPSYIVGCSGHSIEIKDQCLLAGMNDMLTKPVKLKEVTQIIANLKSQECQY